MTPFLASIFLSRGRMIVATAIVVILQLVVILLKPNFPFEVALVVVVMTILIGVMSWLFDTHRSSLEDDRRALLTLAFERERAATEAVQKEREERIRAEESDRVKSAFLASMSHELRTPLNAVINYTKFVSNGTLGDVNTEQKDLLNASAESAEHLLSLINDVLDMSKIESGSLTLFVEDGIDLRRILDTVLATGRTLALNKPIKFDLEVFGDLPVIRGDRQRILQILLNIMSNAVKFTAHGSISINAQRSDDEVMIAIRDTGPGIAPEHHEDVFLPFKQTKAGLRQGGGTGLGMPISRSLAEAHGGRITLESAEGQGSTFTVVLPIQRVALEAAAPA